MSWILNSLTRYLYPSSSNAAAKAASLSLPNQGRMLWIDLEMSGLDVQKDVILEIAAIVTDAQLNELDEGISYVVKTDKKILDNMGEWCTEQHGKTGLTRACLEANLSMKQVESLVLKYVRERMPDEGRALLAGSSVHVDKTWLRKDMPTLHSHLTYRICDVSTVKELLMRWDPDLIDARKQWSRENQASKPDEVAHRALADIRWSIEELRFYKLHAFKL